MMIVRFVGSLFAQSVKRFKTHAFEIFFLKLGSFFSIYLLWIELKVSNDWSMIRESALLGAKDHFLFDLRIFIAWDLPQNSVAPSWYPCLFTRIVVLRSLVIFVGWSEIDFPLCKVTVELVLELNLIIRQLILMWDPVFLKGWNHFIMLFQVLPILSLAGSTDLVIG